MIKALSIFEEERLENLTQAKVKRSSSVKLLLLSLFKPHCYICLACECTHVYIFSRVKHLRKTYTMKYGTDTKKFMKMCVLNWCFTSLKPALSYMGSPKPHLSVKLIVAFRCNHRQSFWFSEATSTDCLMLPFCPKTFIHPTIKN